MLLTVNHICFVLTFCWFFDLFIWFFCSIRSSSILKCAAFQSAKREFILRSVIKELVYHWLPLRYIILSVLISQQIMLYFLKHRRAKSWPQLYQLKDDVLQMHNKLKSQDSYAKVMVTGHYHLVDANAWLDLNP